MDFPPDDIFGMRIGFETSGLITVFRTEFIPLEHLAKRKTDDDALNWSEWSDGFDVACIFDHAATLPIEEFLPRMEAFIASLKILMQSGLPMKERFVEFSKTDDDTPGPAINAAIEAAGEFEG